jgi:uncharacterized protein YdiU (UPF0061 family)
VALLTQLIDFTIERDFPQLASTALEGEALRGEWFAQVCERTAYTIAQWMRVGFVHGVMNTDNMSILGLTIDYGPYGWVDNFDLDWTPNTTDAGGRRYRFGHQPQIAQWNLVRLANALAPAFASHDPLYAGLDRFVAAFNAADQEAIAAKLGLAECTESDLDLMQRLRELLQEAEADMTIFFRGLARIDVAMPTLDPVGDAFYDEGKRHAAEPRFNAWLTDYGNRVRMDTLSPEDRVLRMNAANPRYVLRNYLAQQAIDRAEALDDAGIHDLLEVLRRPYDEQPGREAFAKRRPDWARDRAGCSMLSCSS